MTKDEAGNWYGVEEPRYTVKIKGIDECCNFLIKNTTNNEWFFYSIEESNFAGNFVVIHTRKELEEGGFGWVFNCEGVEVIKEGWIY